MTELLFPITIFVLAILVGFEVISKVPATLHTPLMSGANSIHGIVLVGAMLIAAEADGPGRVRFGALPARPEEPAVIAGDVQRLATEVGFRPTVALEQGIRETVVWTRAAMRAGELPGSGQEGG